MEVLGIVGRALGQLEPLSADKAVHALSCFLEGLTSASPECPAEISLLRRSLITWIVLYVGSLLLYFSFASLDYFIYFILLRDRVLPQGYTDTIELRREISMSVSSLLWMAGLSVPAEVAIQLGYGKVYYRVADYGVTYLLLSPVLFIVFSDCVIYFIHRGLHHRAVYKYIHKPHHSFINTTPFAAFAFHPLDGWLQGVSYQIFVFLLPFHTTVHLVSLSAVSLWTINIHDRVSFGIPGVNGAAHHTIHHTTFKSNYGQYTTLWDRLCGTYRDPWAWKQQGEPILSEKEVYGKDA